MTLNPWTLLLDFFDELRERAEHAHAGPTQEQLEEDERVADATPDTHRPRFESIGAWAGNASLHNPERDVAFAKRIGLDNLEIIVNDHSAARREIPFDTRPVERIARFAAECRHRDIEPTLMTWVMPFEEYLREMGKQLLTLCAATGAKRVMVDAEEPQTLAVKANGRRLSRKDYVQAGEWFREFVVEPLHEIGVEVWVTGIRYTPTHKLFPLLRRLDKKAHAGDTLLRVADGGCPQCYSTKTSKASPFTVIAKGVATWKKKFGNDLKFIVGGAAYRQRGIKGHTVRSAVTAFFDSLEEFFDANPEQPRKVIFWWLTSIRADPRVADVIKSIALEGGEPDPASEATTEPIDVA